MKCPKCGKENENNARFCAMCGADLSQTESHTEAAEEQKPKKKKGKRIFAGIAGILVIAAIIGAGIWIINGKQEKKQYEHTMASGQKYLEELNYESAEDSYLKAIKIDPKEPEPYRKLIETYVAQEKYDDAVEIAQKAQKQVPETKKEEFKKLEQEYHSVIEYEWVVDPTIEADDIYYVCKDDLPEYSINELKIQDGMYVILQKDDICGLIDMQGEMKSEMAYTKIYNDPHGLILQRKTARYIPEFQEKSDTDMILFDGKIDPVLLDEMPTDMFATKGAFYWYNNKLYNTNEYYLNSNIEDKSWFITPTVPDEAIPVQYYHSEYQKKSGSDPIEWWTSAEEKFAVCKNGSLKTDFIYSSLGSCSDGVMAAEKDGKWGYIDENGETVIPFEYDPSWERGFIYDKYGSNNLAWFEEKAFCYAASEGFVPLVKDDQWKLVNTEGETVIPTGVFEAIRPVYDGKCWVKKGGKWGVIKVKEEVETEDKESKNTEETDIGKNTYQFSSGEFLSQFAPEENGTICWLSFWRNYGASASEEDFNFEWEDGKFQYELVGNRSQKRFTVTFTPIDSNSVKIDVVCDEEYYDWQTGERSNIWCSEVYTKVNDAQETEVQDMSVSEIGNAIANHYNRINDSEDYVVFEAETTETETGYKVIVRYQGGPEANQLVSLVDVELQTGKASDGSGQTWYLQDDI